MPNYVRNVLVLVGRQEKVARVIKSLEGKNGPIDLENIIPLPDDSKIDIHNWKISHWGSTDAIDCIMNRENTISFSTSWTPPLKAIEVLAQKFSDVNFRYYWATDDKGFDTGMQIWEKGELIEEIRPYNLVYYYCWDSIRLPA